MPKPQPTARQRIERAFHVSFKLPEQAAELLDAYRDEVLAEFAQADAREILARHRDQVLTEAAEHLDRIADEAEAQVAAHYGPESGIGPGSADMVRECARTLRDRAARTAPDAP